MVDLAAAWLRQAAGVRRVVGVGASMGGSQVVRAAADDAAMDG